MSIKIVRCGSLWNKMSRLAEYDMSVHKNLLPVGNSKQYRDGLQVLYSRV